MQNINYKKSNYGLNKVIKHSVAKYVCLEGGCGT